MTEPAASPRARLESVDLLRGAIMVIMALDHTRDYFGTIGANPVDLATTTPALFMTRWITHVCAPVFFLLTGTGAYLARRRRTTADLSRFLLTRGFWLLVLEWTVLRFGLQFNVDYHVTVLTILWGLGWAMIALGLLVHLPTRAIVAFGLVLIAGHNLFDGVQAQRFGALAPFWSFLHAPGLLFAKPGYIVIMAYPIIPWIGVTAVGYGLGQIFEWTSERRRAFLLRTGVGLTLAFLVLRALNIYGDPSRWSAQSSATFTVLSFLNLTKYPPSLLFLLMTLGPALLVLRAVDGRTPPLLRPALILGKVPMFYFLLHFTLIHLLAVLVAQLKFGDASGMFQSPTLANFPVTAPPGWGFGLPVVYLVWIGVVVALYPLCRWYAGVKARRTDWWLSYL